MSGIWTPGEKLPWWRRALRLPSRRKVFTHTVTPPPQVWTPEFEHPNCRCVVGVDFGAEEPIVFVWPYACHRDGHLYVGAEERCHICGLPWEIENRVTSATFAYRSGQMSELMFRSVLRMEYGSPPVVSV